ncbi:MAG TPA: DUF2065 domain-containing protein [Thiotrichales bacterium]|nr:DUF2065 domain-containing protein [Thiotrichales bacterium]
MGQDLLTALALMLVLEGILPFVSPGTWRRTMLELARMDDRTIRMVGLGSMLVGALLTWIVR